MSASVSLVECVCSACVTVGSQWTNKLQLAVQRHACAGEQMPNDGRSELLYVGPTDTILPGCVYHEPVCASA